MGHRLCETYGWSFWPPKICHPYDMAITNPQQSNVSRRQERNWRFNLVFRHWALRVTRKWIFNRQTNFAIEKGRQPSSVRHTQINLEHVAQRCISAYVKGMLPRPIVSYFGPGGESWPCCNSLVEPVRRAEVLGPTYVGHSIVSERISNDLRSTCTSVFHVVCSAASPWIIRTKYYKSNLRYQCDKYINRPSAKLET